MKAQALKIKDFKLDSLQGNSTALMPGLNASTVYLVLHIRQGYLAFSYYFIFDRIVCALVTFYQ